MSVNQTSNFYQTTPDLYAWLSEETSLGSNSLQWPQQVSIESSPLKNLTRLATLPLITIFPPLKFSIYRRLAGVIIPTRAQWAHWTPPSIPLTPWSWSYEIYTRLIRPLTAAVVTGLSKPGISKWPKKRVSVTPELSTRGGKLGSYGIVGIEP